MLEDFTSAWENWGRFHGHGGLWAGLQISEMRGRQSTWPGHRLPGAGGARQGWAGPKEHRAQEEKWGLGHLCSPKEGPVPKRGNSCQMCVEGLNKHLDG